MKVGAMKYRAVIQQSSITVSAEGYSTPAWTTLTTVWASIEPLTIRETLIAGANTSSQATAKIRIRYLSTVTVGMRVVAASRTYEIVQILDQMNNRELILMCREVV